MRGTVIEPVTHQAVQEPARVTRHGDPAVGGEGFPCGLHMPDPVGDEGLADGFHVRTALAAVHCQLNHIITGPVGVDQRPEPAAGLHRGVLRRIPHQPHGRTRGLGMTEKAFQVTGPDRRGLVHDDHIPTGQHRPVGEIKPRET